jgi:hypothetical protein
VTALLFSKHQIQVEDQVKFCGLLRKPELYYLITYLLMFNLFIFIFQGNNQQKDAGNSCIGAEFCQFQSSTFERATGRAQQLCRSLSKWYWGRARDSYDSIGTERNKRN